MSDRQSRMTDQERRRRLAKIYRMILSWPDAKETAAPGTVGSQTQDNGGNYREADNDR